MKNVLFIDSALLYEKLVEALGQIYCRPDERVLKLIREYEANETHPLAKDMLQTILRNADIACAEGLPCCQDTGTPVLFIEKGEDLCLCGDDILSTIESALEEGWRKYHLRRSLVEEPLFERKIIKDRAAPVIHWEVVPGEGLKVKLALKGGGAENMAAHYMLPTSTDVDGIVAKVVEHVVGVGGQPCPPVIVGIGLGGNFESSAILAKKALLEPTGREHPYPRYAELEKKILSEINRQGKGVMGMGAGPTALAVQILTAPCHIASLPLAINLDCHAHRHTSFTL